MKINIKALTLMLGAGVVLSLTGCGGSGSSDNSTDESLVSNLGDQTVLADGTVNYIDYTGEPRNAVATVAESEYHTGVKFGNTLFDSAEKKCQNCHNELYDTWASSMHGQSWKDKIFQSKFQDFLRTHLAKIGETKDILYAQKTIIGGDPVGTKDMFSGAAQTCIKCHAPGAYYANDVKVTVTDLGDASDINTTELLALKLLHEENDYSGETAVIAANSHKNRIYKATFQIGHEANREGINCAFCHSIETPRIMKSDGLDNGEYTLAGAIRVGPHGPIMDNATDTLLYDKNASNRAMNHFFRLWGPEKYTDYANTPKGITTGIDGIDAGEFDVAKSKDGRYTMHSTDLNGTGGKVHFTGGPFYGPYGITGKTNENLTDQTDRKSHINPHYDKDNNNHFGESGKGLCLSCHQRSAGAKVPGTDKFMELCSTQIAVSTGDDTGSNDTDSSPKCQKCHMERIEGVLLHKWARPDQRWTLADNPELTPEFDVNDATVPAGHNPVRDGWLNSHAFLGASKTGQAASVTAKIKSGFDASISTSVAGNILTVTTTFTNKTAHMFPGAHPMRRVLSRVIVTDETGAKLNVLNRTGESTFDHISNDVQPLQDKVLHETALSPVPVLNNGSEDLSFPGKVADLNGPVVSQKFDMSPVIIPGTDSTIKSQTVILGATTGTVKNAAIVESTDPSNFTRVYGHETGKKYNNVFVVRPGFDSNMVESDNRLSPNETETYTLTYDISGKSGVSATYKIYYMQKGANGSFPTTSDGWLNKDPIYKSALITEVGSYTEAL